MLLLLTYCYCFHITPVTSASPGAAELTTPLLSLISILWLPFCRINKLGFYFPKKLLRSPILVGSRQGWIASLTTRQGWIASPASWLAVLPQAPFCPGCSSQRPRWRPTHDVPPCSPSWSMPTRTSSSPSSSGRRRCCWLGGRLAAAPPPHGLNEVLGCRCAHGAPARL